MFWKSRWGLFSIGETPGIRWNAPICALDRSHIRTTGASGIEIWFGVIRIRFGVTRPHSTARFR
jgi:hypothetical protein